MPYNPYNLRYPKWGSTLVAAAGPASNLLMIVVFGLVFKLVYPFLPLDNLLVAFLELLIQLNLILCLFNLIPIPPLDGSNWLWPSPRPNTTRPAFSSKPAAAFAPRFHSPRQPLRPEHSLNHFFLCREFHITVICVSRIL